MKTKFILMIILIVFISGCASQQPADDKITIATTFYPLYDLTRAIAGNNANVYSIVPLNAEPHEYETTPQDVIKLNNAEVFVTMGISFAGFEDQLIKSASSNVHVIPAGEGIPLIDVPLIDVKDELGDLNDEEISGKDPHIWVSPKTAIIMAEHIRDGLIAADPEHTQGYQENAEQLIQSLTELDQNFTTTLSHCNQDTILVAHNAYSYLGRDYHFKTIFISGLTPESEPTPQQIKRLIDQAQEHHLKYIFYESMVDPKVSQTIAEQIGATALPLSPVEGVEDPHETYIEVMNENLNKLKLALDCTP